MNDYTMIYESLVSKFKNQNTQGGKESSLVKEKIVRSVSDMVTYVKVEE